MVFKMVPAARHFFVVELRFFFSAIFIVYVIYVKWLIMQILVFFVCLLGKNVLPIMFTGLL